MLILIILLFLLILGIILTNHIYNFEFPGLLITVVSGIYLFVHVLCWSLASYDYDQFVVKRQAFVETLEYARKNENSFELAAISREISEWNQKLASLQYDNNVFLLKDYIDDRIITLEPIR